MSPSVMMPRTFSFLSTTAAAPRRLLEISEITNFMLASGDTCGFSFCTYMSFTFKYSFLPSEPPGWNFAKSSGVKPFISSRATVSASPTTSWAVVLEVGARLCGEASESTVERKTMSADFAKKDSVSDTIAISRLLLRFISGIKTLISGVLPLFDMQITTSSS